jgi:5,10-methylenetetrahydromethanopterin reductase
MVQVGFQYLETAPWYGLAPSSTIFVAALGVNLLGDPCGTRSSRAYACEFRGELMSRPLSVLLFSEYSSTELVELGQLCEVLGYEQLWYADVRFLRECYLGLAALAARTSRIRLGPGVTDPYSRHPALTAASIATLDELSEGRALLGLGTGGTGFRELGIAAPLPVAALRETVDVVRRLLRGEEVHWQGKVVTLLGGRLQFSPRRSAVPIYFATHGAQVARLAGEVADGVLLANIVVPSAVDFYLERLREGAAKAGRSLSDVDVSLRFEVAIAEDEAAAFAVMRRRVAARLIAGYPHWEFLEQLQVTLPPAFAELAARKDPKLANEAAAELPAEAVDATVLYGRPERVAARIAPVLVPEVTRVTIRPHAVPGQNVGAVLQAFAQEVMPRLGGR